MKPPKNPVAVFALDEDFAWEDLEDAMSGCANWQSANRGKIIPLLFFAPMTPPANPDAWEPMKGMPRNLFIISIERSTDATLLKEIVKVHHPLLEETLLSHCLVRFYWLRDQPEVRKRPSTSELLDWITALVKSGIPEKKLEEHIPFLGSLLKKETDLQHIRQALTRGAKNFA